MQQQPNQQGFFPSYDEGDNQNMFNNTQQMYPNNQNIPQDMTSSNYQQFPGYGSSSASQFYQNNSGYQDFNTDNMTGDFQNLGGFGDNFDNFGDFQQNSGFWGPGWNNSGYSGGSSGDENLSNSKKPSDFGLVSPKTGSSNALPMNNKTAGGCKFETEDRKDEKAESMKKEEIPHDWVSYVMYYTRKKSGIGELLDKEISLIGCGLPETGDIRQ